MRFVIRIGQYVTNAAWFFRDGFCKTTCLTSQKRKEARWYPYSPQQLDDPLPYTFITGCDNMDKHSCFNVCLIKRI